MTSPSPLATKALLEFNEVEREFDPGSLFSSGDPKLLNSYPRISVVGSRKASERGLETARKISEAIVGRGGVVVSGLARGIDTAAHKAAIEANGRTIAVLGTGLDISYPKENAELQECISKEHLVISQFPDGTPPRRGNFPMRNKTMALLSHCSIIVEAGESSGTEHQGWTALKLARPLLFPEELLEKDFSWPREMQEYGAIAFSPTNINSWLDQIFWQ